MEARSPRDTPGVETINRWLRKSLTGRWKGVVASLIVLALTVSGVGVWKLIEYIEWMNSETRREREAWLRRHWWGPGLWWNFSSASGFDLGYRGDERMLTLLRGETGIIELVISTEDRPCEHTEYGNLYEACKLSLYGTIGCSGDPAILPPGVRAEFTPPNVTLRAGGNVSVLHTITADRDAPTGCYYYGVGIRIADHGTGYSASIWLVVGPYTPHGNFSLVGDPVDFIARDEINISRKVGVEIWMKCSLNYGFTIRSEGPPLNVTLEIVNIDMPEEVKLSVPKQVFVPAGSQVLVVENVDPYASPEVGRTYHFKVIARSGNETHVANYEILVYIP